MRLREQLCANIGYGLCRCLFSLQFFGSKVHFIRKPLRAKDWKLHLAEWVWIKIKVESCIYLRVCSLCSGESLVWCLYFVEYFYSLNEAIVKLANQSSCYEYHGNNGDCYYGRCYYCVIMTGLMVTNFCVWLIVSCLSVVLTVVCIE